MRWERIAIIGVGLIGGSIGLALRRQRLCETVIGIGRRPESLDAALRVGAVDQVTTSLAAGVREAQLIVVCSPVDCIAEHVISAAKHCPNTAVITDAGSTKERIVREVQRQWDRSRDVSFVGSHPIAGSEQTGPLAARADLFVGRTVILTPTRELSGAAADNVEQFWQALGAQTVRQSPAKHDRLLAATSHLPHVVAAALAACTTDGELAFTGSGWADLTRIAAGDPELWCQILMHNRDYVLDSLKKFDVVLDRFREALTSEDPAQLKRLLRKGKSQRDAVGN